MALARPGWGGPEVPPVQDCGGLAAECHPSSICFVALDRRWTCGEFVLIVSRRIGSDERTVWVGFSETLASEKRGSLLSQAAG